MNFMPEIEISVKANVPYKAPLDVLEQFIETARDHGLTHFTWSAYNGSQMEPSQLTLNASLER